MVGLLSLGRVLLKDVISDMPDFITEGEDEPTIEQQVQSREYRSLAKELVQRVNRASGKGGLEGALDRGDIIQTAITPKEQQFLLQIVDAFGSSGYITNVSAAKEEIGKLPAKGWY